MNPRDKLSATIEEIIERRTDGGGGAGLATDEIMRLFGSAMVLEATTPWHELAEWLKAVPSFDIRVQDVLDKMSQLDPEVPADDEDIRPRKTPMSADKNALDPIEEHDRMYGSDADEEVKRYRAHLGRHPDRQDGGWPITGDDPEAMNTVEAISAYRAAADYMRAVGLEPTEDAIEQLAGPFTVCLRIMCERGYEPSGALWKQSGVLGVLTDVQKKFDRFWYRTWTLGRRHDDSGYDLINFTAMCLRLDPDSRFGQWGEPALDEPRFEPLDELDTSGAPDEYQNAPEAD